MKLPIELLTLNSTYGKFGQPGAMYAIPSSDSEFAPAPIPGSACLPAGLSVAAAETVAGQCTGGGEHLQSATTHPLVGTQVEIQIDNGTVTDIYEVDPPSGEEVKVEWDKLPADRYYDFQVDVIRAKDPAMALKYEQLKMYESPFVGKITTIELAAKHMLSCLKTGQPMTGHYPKEPQLEGYQGDPRYAHHHARRLAIEEARKAWKAGVVKRRQAVAEWDQYVEKLHAEYKRMVRTSPDDFKTDASIPTVPK